MAYPKISLDQWRTLVAIVDAGGYAQAAEAVNRSQSTLTYAVQKLEHIVGTKVFEIQGRRAVLTPAGQMLYRRGKALVEQAVLLERAAQKIAEGWEPEIRIAVEIIFPTWLLLQVFERFGQEHPDTRLELYESVLDGTTQALVEGRVDLAVGPFVPPGYLADPLAEVRFVCAAHPEHALHQLNRPVTKEDLRMHRHLIVRDTSAQRAREMAWLNERRWTVSNKATSIRAATMGLGYAWYAENTISEEIAAGKLKALPLVEGSQRVGWVYLMYADFDAMGPGVRRLAELLREAVAEFL
jgi:DNA-binding transcriptional LysR family regulator